MEQRQIFETMKMEEIDGELRNRRNVWLRLALYLGKHGRWKGKYMNV